MRTRIIVVAWFFNSLLGNVEPRQDLYAPYSLKTDSTSLSAIRSNEGSIDSFVITSNLSWQIAIVPATATWLKLSATTGCGHAKIYVTTCRANTTRSVQTTAIIINPEQGIDTTITIPVTRQPVSPHLVWSTLMGSSAANQISAMIGASDSGYVGVGMTIASNKDTTGYYASFDMLVVKLDNRGGKVWTNTFGGSLNDELNAIALTADGGYIVAGGTNSKDGDISFNYGNSDIFVMKLDVNGKKMWAKTFGGSAIEVASSIITTADGGFALAGYTFSNEGDFTDNHGQSDLFVMKLDSSGNKKWTKTIGGSADDFGNTIVSTKEGGYAVGGYTRSIDGDFTGSSQLQDGFVVRMDVNGNRLWVKKVGGSAGDFGNAIVATADGGFLLAGETNSNNGDIPFNLGGSDIFVVKLDAYGRKLWAKTFGGTGDDEAHALVKTADGGYIVTGYSSSPDGDVSTSRGLEDILVVKLDANGEKIWANTFGGSGGDFPCSIAATIDGSYVIAGYTYSNDGDVKGNRSDEVNGCCMKISE